LETAVVVDYAKCYDHYWSLQNSSGGAGAEEAIARAEEVVVACGGGKLVDIGCGTGTFVRAALRLGIEARGIDVSQACTSVGNACAPGRFDVGSILELPYLDGQFETVVCIDTLQHLERTDIPVALGEVRRICRGNVYLEIGITPGDKGLHRTIETRAWWEARCFEAGLRKHPGYYRINPYESLEEDGSQIRVLLEPVPQLASDRYPMDTLLRERDLHMDMLRESGARSDAHVIRYEWASRFIRPGDVVLDAACGLGYGSYLIQSLSESSNTTGVDNSEFAIAYASANFASRISGLDFRQGVLPGILSSFRDNSVDMIVSFETLEHVEHPESLLSEFYRILKPTGRIVCSVPNDWTDETGRDPNPFHFHVYDLGRLRKELSAHFLLERIGSQSASRRKQGPLGQRAWAPARREILEFNPAQLVPGMEPDAEWWLALATKSPIAAADVRYEETTYPTFSDGQWNPTAFRRDYKNPWLVRSMVSTAHRIADPFALGQIAQETLLRSPPSSSDTGAALCVLAYQMLGRDRTTLQDLETFSSNCELFLSAPPANPHGIRWRVSLLFVLGRLWMRAGNFPRASEYLQRCTEIEACLYSPLLANRTVEACVLLGQITLQTGSPEAAARWWQKGIALASDALSRDWRETIGNFDNPADFALPELASITEHASVCGFALANFARLGVKRNWWMNLMRRDRLTQIRLLHAGLDRMKADIFAYDSQARQLTQSLSTQQAELTAAYAQIDSQRETLRAYTDQTATFLDQERRRSDELAAAYAQIESQRETIQAYADQAEVFLDRERRRSDELAVAHQQIERQRAELAAYAKQRAK